jgi:CheY-like chemotaxis protein
MATILLTDDDAITRYVMNVVLESHGHSVLFAATPHQAIAVSTQQVVDLLITDIQMPRMDGFELARHVQEHNPSTRVMFVSGYPYPECTLVKPYTAESLIAAVEAMLNGDGSSSKNK